MREIDRPRLPASFTGQLRARVRRLEPPNRLPGVDLARGVAVLGMFAAHLIDTTPLQWNSPETWTGMVDGRSSILFATLAGLSLGLSQGGETDQGGRGLTVPRRRLLARAATIWALGILLITLAVPVNVILPAYGVLFAIAVALVTLPTRTLVLVAAVLAVVMPFVVGMVNAVTGGAGGESTSRIALMLGWHYPFPLWAAFLAAGLAAGRVLVASPRRAIGLAGAGATLALIGYVVLGPVGDRAARALDDGASNAVGL